jgi:hypothetical protein
MWNVKAKVIPVITGRLEPFQNYCRQYLSNIPGRREIKELPKTNYIVHSTQTAGSADVKVQDML